MATCKQCGDVFEAQWEGDVACSNVCRTALLRAIDEKRQARRERIVFLNSLPNPCTADWRLMAIQKTTEVRPLSHYVYEPKAGFIYIIHCVGFPYYKIGQSVMPKGRVDTLQTGVPFELVLEYAIAVKDMNETERRTHDHFKDKRVNGEWFLFTDEELDAAKSLIVSLKDCVWERRMRTAVAPALVETNRLTAT